MPAKPRTSPDPIDKPPELPGREIPPKLPGKPDLPGRGPLELPGKPDLSGRGGRPELPGRGPPELPGREGPPELPGRPNLPMRGGLPELPGRPDLPERGGPPELPGRPSLPGRNVPDRNATNPPTSYSDPSQPPEFPKLPQRPHHDLNDISSQSWYHKGITREQATVKIKRYHKVSNTTLLYVQAFQINFIRMAHLLYETILRIQENIHFHFGMVEELDISSMLL